MNPSSDVLDRINRLEIQNNQIARQNARLSVEVRRYKWLGAASLLVVLFSFLVGAAAGPSNIEAESLLLRGKDGSLYASLSLDSDGSSQLKFMGKGGRVPLRLGLIKDFPVISFAGPTGHVRLASGLAPDGTPITTLYDDAGKSRLAMAVTNDGSPRLTLSDQANKVQMRMTVNTAGKPSLEFMRGANGTPAILVDVDENGAPGIRMSDGNGEYKLVLAVSKNGVPQLVHYNKGNARLQLSLFEDGQPFLNFYDEHSRTTVNLEDRNGRRGITFYDAAGKVRLIEGLDKGGAPTITCADQHENIRIGLSLLEDGNPFLFLNDNKNKNRIHIGISSRDGEPFFLLKDQDGVTEKRQR